MKRILSLVMCLLIVVVAMPLSAITVSAVSEGTCGDNATWVLDDQGVLTISGEGEIEESAFHDNAEIKEVIINQGITSIGDYAFNYCLSLTGITIPDSVISIGEGIFSTCNSLESISVGSNNQHYSSIDGVLFNKDATTIIKCPKGNARTSYSIPNSVITIGEKAFAGCTSLIDITIPDSVTSISEDAFYGCNSLTDIIIPNSVITIGREAFAGCTSLADVTFSNSLTSIGDYAFYYCPGLTEITFPDSLTSIGYSAFASCDGLTGVTIPDSVTHLGNYAFLSCDGLISVTIPDSVTSIGGYTFHGCDNLTTITIPKSVTSIGYLAFYECPSLISVYYYGTPIDWNNIAISHKNECLLNAKIYYYCDIKGHKYSNSCDTKCNTCGEKRTTSHAYTKYTTVKATLSANGYTLRECPHCGKDYSKTTIYRPETFEISTTKYTYDGKAKTPSVKVYGSDGKQISSKYYTITYSNNKKVGKATATVKFKTKYSGSLKLAFTIVPKATTLSSVATSGSKALKVTWKKQTSQTSGYQVQYSASKKFTSAKTVTVSGSSKTSTTIKKLSAKKTYYVRVRTYKTVDGKKYYSSWSSYKYKKTK